MKANLPNFFAFKSANDLIRLGRDNDGGYLVSKADLERTNLLLGLGIDKDWSFEEDFRKKANVKLIAYDGSVGFLSFLKIFVKLFLTLRLLQALKILKILIRFRIFFSSEKKIFKKSFIGNDDLLEKRNFEPLKNIFEENLQKNIFLKIDVEGSEYRFLDTLIKYQNNISGLVIEMHDCDLNLKKIENFISKFELKLVHIHANNDASLSNNFIPTVLELTFSRYCKFSEFNVLPHVLDMPNCKNKPEIDLVIND